MNGIKIGVALIGAAMVLAVGGCTFLSPIEQTTGDDSEDAVGFNVGGVDVRDLVIITNDGDGPVAVGSLLLTAQNTAGDARVLAFMYDTSHGEDETAVKVPANAEVTRGTTPDDPQLLVRDLLVPAGGLLPVTIRSTDGEEKHIEIPILTGAQPQYATLTPSPASASGLRSEGVRSWWGGLL